MICFVSSKTILDLSSREDAVDAFLLFNAEKHAFLNTLILSISPSCPACRTGPSSTCCARAAARAPPRSVGGRPARPHSAGGRSEDQIFEIVKSMICGRTIEGRSIKKCAGQCPGREQFRIISVLVRCSFCASKLIKANLKRGGGKGRIRFANVVGYLLSLFSRKKNDIVDHVYCRPRSEAKKSLSEADRFCDNSTFATVLL